MTAVNRLLEKLEDSFTSGDRKLCTEYSPTSAITSLTCKSAQEMSPNLFQKLLRSKHIIIPDYNLPEISCDRRGLMSLNSLKEHVNIEGK